MSRQLGSTLLRGAARQSGSCPSRLFRITPPPPPLCRTFLTRRQTSFYTHSYPPVTYSAEVPYVPPNPEASGSTPSVDDHSSPSSHQPTDGKRKERKERYLESLMDKAGELSLRCSILDSSGNWRAEEGRYKKTELCREHDLDPRDLRKLDSLTPNLVPLILTRRSCILVSMLHIRALIKPDRIIVFDSVGSTDSEVSRKFKWHLERNIKAGIAAREEEELDCEEEDIGLVYEHRALESILVATSNALEEEMGYTRNLVRDLLADLEDDINRDNLKRLLHYSRRMAGFQSRARYVKRAVDEVLESDEDLSAMYISARAMGKPRALHDHEQLELLLESFVKQVEEIVSEVDTTVANMQSTQEIAELMLDSGRNALLALDIKVSIATLGVGTGALIAGFFGMNLSTHLEQTEYAFLAVASGASIVAFLVFLYGARILRKVRRVALSGRAPASLRMLAIPMRQGSPIAWSPVSPITGRQVSPRAQMSLLRRPTLLDRIFRRKAWRHASRIQTSDPRDPVWINEKADQARARDAFMAGWTGKATPSGDREEVPKGWRGFDEDWKSSRFKAKWAKE